jgi:hypothetical protein
MLLFAITGSGESLLVTARSVSVITGLDVLALLLLAVGSLVVVDIELVVVMVDPFAALEFTFTT